MRFLAEREISDKTTQLDSLDGLRGFAALVVVLSHTSIAGLYFLPGFDFQGLGKTGVYLFFLLSAFLLTYQLISKCPLAFDGNNIGKYFFRRVLRIYPLFLCYLIAALITTAIFKSLLPGKALPGYPFDLVPTEFVSHLLLLQTKGPEWSVVVEFQYYIMLPIIAYIYSGLFKNKLLPSGIFTILIVAVSLFLWPSKDYVTNDTRLGIYLPVFLIGSYLAVLHNWAVKRQSLLSSDNKLVFEILGAIAIIVIITMTPSVNSYLLNEKLDAAKYHKEFLIYAILWSAVLFSTIHGTGLLKSIFGLKLLRYCGYMSFSIYLIHSTVIRVVESISINKMASAWLVLTLVLLLSTISYRLIELPSSKYKPWK